MALAKQKALFQRHPSYARNKLQKKSAASDHPALNISDPVLPSSMASIQETVASEDSSSYGLAVEARTRGSKSVLAMEQAIQEAVDEAL